MALVESIPEHMQYKGNVTFGIPLERVWNDLIAAATDQVDVVSFYWTLTGEDIGVNSSSDVPVSYQLRWIAMPLTVAKNIPPNLCCMVSLAGKEHPERTRRLAIQERDCPSGGQHSRRQYKLHRFRDLKTKRFVDTGHFVKAAERSRQRSLNSCLFCLPAGVHVRKVNFGRLTNGVLHTKFWIVDRRHVFIGSANMDWRALTQVNEH